MSYILSENNNMSDITMGKAYFRFLNKNMKANPDMIHVETDLGLSLLKGDLFSVLDKYPFQFVEAGIQEANAVGVACGLSAANKIPFVHSFSTFMSRRVMDQVFISGAYSKSNVKMIGSDPGVLAAFNGGTHMSFEDVGMMRVVPEMTIVEPSDPVMAEEVFNLAARQEGMFYIRFARKNRPTIYKDGSRFEIGKGNIIKEGSDVTIIAAGIMVEEGLKAVEILKNEGISAKLIDMFTIKPIDEDLVIRCAKETGAIVTAENHNVIGGLGSAVTETVMKSCLVPVECVGVKDVFGQVGDVEFLKETYKLTGEEIASKAKLAINRKQ